MNDDQQTADVDLRDIEAELCRLPDVVAARMVADGVGRPIEVHILAQTGKHAKQIVRDVQSVALASFGLELDRRIVSVVQLSSNGDTPHQAPPTAPSRVRIVATEIRTTDLRTTVRVTLGLGEEETTGFAEGSTSMTMRQRLVAVATVDALRQLDSAAQQLEVETAQVVKIGADDVLIVTLVCLEPPHEQRLTGSAIVRQHLDDAAVRAALDATNRRLSHLAGATTP